MTLTINPDTLTTWHLANMAGVASPDRPDGIGFAESPADPDPSPGATFLRNIARDLAERLDYNNGDPDDPDDLAHEVADGAVPVYTFERWQTFTDLAGWAEVDRYGDGCEVDGLPLSGDLTDQAGQVLYAIAQRLVGALIAEVDA